MQAGEFIIRRALWHTYEFSCNILKIPPMHTVAYFQPEIEVMDICLVFLVLMKKGLLRITDQLDIHVKRNEVVEHPGCIFPVIEIFFMK